MLSFRPSSETLLWTEVLSEIGGTILFRHLVSTCSELLVLFRFERKSRTPQEEPGSCLPSEMFSVLKPHRSRGLIFCFTSSSNVVAAFVVWLDLVDEVEKFAILPCVRLVERSLLPLELCSMICWGVTSEPKLVAILGSFPVDISSESCCEGSLNVLDDAESIVAWTAFAMISCTALISSEESRPLRPLSSSRFDDSSLRNTFGE